MQNQRVIRVYLLDDCELVRRGVVSLLEPTDDLEVVGEARTCAHALPEILRLRPDVVVLDARLSDGSGVGLARELRAVDPSIKCLILATQDDPETISSAILAGASGYVLKRIDGASLVSGIRLVADGHSLIDPSVAARVVEQMRSQKRSMDQLGELTSQQRRILLLIAEGLTNRQIAQKLFLAEKTVKNHVTGLLARLGLQHRTQAALLVGQLRDSRPLPPATATGARPVVALPRTAAAA
ncbi:MAG TPA: response regulator transcription factor [Nocardioides sp.]|nr:response regulator transcription factor [Nocardioides sp.]